jgi:hypothetical protein
MASSSGYGMSTLGFSVRSIGATPVTFSASFDFTYNVMRKCVDITVEKAGEARISVRLSGPDDIVSQYGGGVEDLVFEVKRGEMRVQFFVPPRVAGGSTYTMQLAAPYGVTTSPTPSFRLSQCAGVVSLVSSSIVFPNSGARPWSGSYTFLFGNITGPVAFNFSLSAAVEPWINTQLSQPWPVWIDGVPGVRLCGQPADASSMMAGSTIFLSLSAYPTPSENTSFTIQLGATGVADAGAGLPTPSVSFEPSSITFRPGDSASHAVTMTLLTGEGVLRYFATSTDAAAANYTLFSPQTVRVTTRSFVVLSMADSNQPGWLALDESPAKFIRVWVSPQLAVPFDDDGSSIDISLRLVQTGGDGALSVNGTNALTWSSGQQQPQSNTLLANKAGLVNWQLQVSDGPLAVVRSYRTVGPFTTDVWPSACGRSTSCTACTNSVLSRCLWCAEPSSDGGVCTPPDQPVLDVNSPQSRACAAQDRSLIVSDLSCRSLSSQTMFLSPPTRLRTGSTNVFVLSPEYLLSPTSIRPRVYIQVSPSWLSASPTSCDFAQGGGNCAIYLPVPVAPASSGQLVVVSWSSTLATAPATFTFRIDDATPPATLIVDNMPSSLAFGRQPVAVTVQLSRALLNPLTVTLVASAADITSTPRSLTLAVGDTTPQTFLLQVASNTLRNTAQSITFNVKPTAFQFNPEVAQPDSFSVQILPGVNPPVVSSSTGGSVGPKPSSSSSSSTGGSDVPPRPSESSTGAQPPVAPSSTGGNSPVPPLPPRVPAVQVTFVLEVDVSVVLASGWSSGFLSLVSVHLGLSPSRLSILSIVPGSAVITLQIQPADSTQLNEYSPLEAAAMFSLQLADPSSSMRGSALLVGASDTPLHLCADGVSYGANCPAAASDGGGGSSYSAMQIGVAVAVVVVVLGALIGGGVFWYRRRAATLQTQKHLSSGGATSGSDGLELTDQSGGFSANPVFGARQDSKFQQFDV